jgi:PBP1b-binding outer membrane lipoprotein LpoB
MHRAFVLAAALLVGGCSNSEKKPTQPAQPVNTEDSGTATEFQTAVKALDEQLKTFNAGEEPAKVAVRRPLNETSGHLDVTPLEDEVRRCLAASGRFTVVDSSEKPPYELATRVKGVTRSNGKTQQVTTTYLFELIRGTTCVLRAQKELLKEKS